MKPLQTIPLLLAAIACCGGTERRVDETASRGRPDAADASAEANDAAGPFEALCDGSNGLRVRIALEGGGPDSYGSSLRTNHGFEVLEIDGHCSYSMNAGWQTNLALSRDRGWRTGTLDPATAASLASALPLADLSRLADCVDSHVSDAPGRIIRTARSKVVCGGTGPRFEAAWAVVRATVAQLWPRAFPLDGPMRVSAVEIARVPGGHAPYAWPLGQLVPFLRANRADVPDDAHTLVTDPESARKLRALRETYLTAQAMTPGVFTSWDGLVVSDGVTTAVTYMRDALPHEDQLGHPPF